MRKPLQVGLYLVVVTLVVFYGQKVLTTRASSGKTRAEIAHMAESAYYSVRAVAGMQLSHILVTYRVDETSGRHIPQFRNQACPNPHADPEELKKGLEALQEELHEQRAWRPKRRPGICRTIGNWSTVVRRRSGGFSRPSEADPIPSPDDS